MANVIFVLSDSLNRHFLPIYGNDWVTAPNISRLAERSVTFEQHYTASAPCMPARRDLWTGCIEFPWRYWGPAEPYDELLPHLCRKAGVATQMFTDHYHYWEVGGTGYHSEFDGCEMIRGHEYDYWISDPSLTFDEPRRMLKERWGHSKVYLKNRSRFRTEADFPSPKTMAAACEWLDRNHAHGPFLLAVECFDPHEPFHVPPPYDTMYGPPVENETYWPRYGKADAYEPDVLRRIRHLYAGKITMLDTWLGRLLDRLDKYRLWDDTLVILTTDHGHYLGEHNALGKPYVGVWQTLFHIPLIIHMPGGPEGKRIQALSLAVDLTATMCDFLGLTRSRPSHGRSLLPVLRGEKDSVRDWALMGYWGQSVGITDGKWKLHQAPVPENQPLFMYGVQLQKLRGHVPLTEGVEVGRFVPYAPDALVLKNPARLELGEEQRKSMLFDITSDEGETSDLIEEQLEEAERMRRMLRGAFEEIRVPDEQYIRLGLK